MPFKLAITGTPMENSLTDLWSLFKIVAPGLFPSARKFREDYLRPIVAGHGAKELTRLRKSIRPLMMRRTKELVAADLPEKQEQVLYVDLSPKHRKLYDTVLQRERQKLLGLVPHRLCPGVPHLAEGGRLRPQPDRGRLPFLLETREYTR